MFGLNAVQDVIFKLTTFDLLLSLFGFFTKLDKVCSL